MKKLLFIALMLVAVSSCTENSDGLSAKKVDRQDFIRGKDEAQIKASVLELPFNDQKFLWLDKFAQILSSELPESHSRLIESLSNEFKNTNSINDIYSNSNMLNYVIELSKITSESDFKLMFMNLDDYKIVPSSFDKSYSCINCALSLKNQWLNTVETFKENTNGGRAALQLPKCNCDWTCPDGSNGVDCTTKKCTPTSSGCGFLFLFSCDEKVVICGTV